MGRLARYGFVELLTHIFQSSPCRYDSFTRPRPTSRSKSRVLCRRRCAACRWATIERFEIFHGNEQRPLADFFAVSGETSDGRIDFDGDLQGVHWIGAGMTEGVIRVNENVGRHLGSEMTGGEVHVAGNAGDWVGGEMHGGLIHVRGRAGNLIGAAYRGSPRGMTGGTILIDGDVGNEVGHTMRRGLLAVGGACGDFVGINMIAGTILVFGACGIRPGAGMRRGTHRACSAPSHPGCSHLPRRRPRQAAHYAARH